jgi:indolepyruvate ferredoxin oxidoreductase
MSSGASSLLSIDLDDKYTLEQGRVYLNGNQALVRLPLMQRRRDLAAGLDTAGFISGYRGSPLGGYDIALWRAKEHLAEHRIHFEPGINEDMAATAVWGSQQVGLIDGARHDGVFSIWYGKGPGVDRSGDALKHGAYSGTAPHGGVLVLTGDDHGAKSSTIAHQSEHALIHFGMPILNPATVQDYLDFGLLGWALSRYSGCWVGFKCTTDTVESSASVEVGDARTRMEIPRDFELPEGGLNIRWGMLQLDAERLLYRHKLEAAKAFVRANGLDRVVQDAPRRRLGIVTTGKAYLDLRQALDELGLGEARASELGLSIYKLGVSWPVEPEGLRDFARGHEELMIVEEKRPVVEEQLAHLLYNLPADARPRLVGKRDERGAPLLSAEGELSPGDVAEALGARLHAITGDAALAETLRVRREAREAITLGGGGAALMRLPSFCAGCPHNTSTHVPEDSIAMGGIGCHGMAVWLPERRTMTLFQMGGEGAPWIGQAPFTDTAHIFQNLGDGTYFHSGLLAIRATVVANVNITFKILLNGAIAMTGGQPIEGGHLEGEVTAPMVAAQVRAEGVERIAVLSDEPGKYEHDAGFPPRVTFHSRDDLDDVQRELRGVAGTSVLIYDQTCAAEKRRLRKRGLFPDPDQRLFINEAVCEGCGDCGAQSNCIAIEPVETDLGRKRRIDQSSCNKDYSCLKGLCPSFVTVRGGRLRKASPADGNGASGPLHPGLDALPPPASAESSDPYGILVAGIGGSGVVTIGALLGMAAHLEGKGCSVLDVAGLSQKNGPVTSHVRIADDPDDLHAVRIGGGGADLLLGCDIVVASGMEPVAKIGRGRTRVVVDRHVAPTSAFASNPDLDFSRDAMVGKLVEAAGAERTLLVDVRESASALLGDAIAGNLFILGYALQKGLLPITLDALVRAIELNGVAVEMNKQALAWGRLAAHDPDAIAAAIGSTGRADAGSTQHESLDALVERRAKMLRAYQSDAYAQRYRDRIARVRETEQSRTPGREALARAAADAYAKLLAYKDEYEVARLYSEPAFLDSLQREFEGSPRIELNLAPPLLARRDPRTGRFRKIRLGAWFMPALRVLARLKVLRGTPLDLFSLSAHRRMERGLIGEYELTLEELMAGLDERNHALACEIAALPQRIRGFDVVKESAVAEVGEQRDKLMERYREGPVGAD